MTYFYEKLLSMGGAVIETQNLFYYTLKIISEYVNKKACSNNRAKRKCEQIRRMKLPRNVAGMGNCPEGCLDDIVQLLPESSRPPDDRRCY